MGRGFFRFTVTPLGDTPPGHIFDSTHNCQVIDQMQNRLILETNLNLQEILNLIQKTTQQSILLKQERIIGNFPVFVDPLNQI